MRGRGSLAKPKHTVPTLSQIRDKYQRTALHWAAEAGQASRDGCKRVGRRCALSGASIALIRCRIILLPLRSAPELHIGELTLSYDSAFLQVEAAECLLDYGVEALATECNGR